MFHATMTNTTLSEAASLPTSFNPLILQNTNIITPQPSPPPQPSKTAKKKRSLPGNPDPDAEVIALSPKTLLATNRFICEICNKGFQRDQNLQLHKRGHNVPWKLKQRSNKDVVKKKVYVCPEPTCVHHNPSRALGDLTGIKKHFCRKHGEKKFKCDKCSKIYAVQSDWKAHSKICGTREYRCDCGTLFSRKDSFITHRAFCDALAEESARFSTNPFNNSILPPPPQPPRLPPFSTIPTTSDNPSHLFPLSSSTSSISLYPSPWDPLPQNPNNNIPNPHIQIKTEYKNPFSPPPPPLFFPPPPPFTSLHVSSQPCTSDSAATTPGHFRLSATALLQKAATMLGSVTPPTTTSSQSSSLTQLADHNHHQAMLMSPSGFDNDLGASSFRHVDPASLADLVVDSSIPLPLQQLPQSSSSTMDHHQYSNLGLGAGSLATWQKSDGLTRDFLGLTAGDHYGNGKGADDGVVGNMVKFTGGLQYGMTAAYDRDNSSSSIPVLFKPQPLVLGDHHHHHEGFDFAAADQPPANNATQTRWGC